MLFAIYKHFNHDLHLVLNYPQLDASQYKNVTRL